MADVFISYKRDERPAVEKIAGKLQDIGLSVWFDASMTAGETFNNEIDREAREAKCILVCWSPTARDSKWVIAEAMIGFEKDKLIACYVAGPDSFSPPTPFNAIHAEDLRGWLGDPSETHAGWKSILRGAGKLCERVDVESFGALGARTSTDELRGWIDRHSGSPLLLSVEELLRAQEIQDVERERLGREARERRAREDAERQARETAERERRESEERERREAEVRESAKQQAAAKRPLWPWLAVGVAIVAIAGFFGVQSLLRKPATSESQVTAESAKIFAGDGTILSSDEQTASGAGVAEANHFLAEVIRQVDASEARGGNLQIRTYLDLRLQRAAVQALRQGLDAYDRRHGMAARTDSDSNRIQGALVALDPHTGRVLAMVGGYNSQGPNRAIQVTRQPGSAYMPVVYAAALDFGLTPATLVEDAPLSSGNLAPEREYLGPTTLRRGLELSRSAMTARVASEIGAERVLNYGRRLGIYGNDTQAQPALALGAGETTLMRLTTAYGMFVNGGREIRPILLDRVQDSAGRTIIRSDRRACPDCSAEWRGQQPPTLPDVRAQVLDPITAFQIVSMTEGVVQRGAGTAAGLAGVPLGGKTGSSNDNKDAWFVGYAPDLVVGVWAGYDTPRNLGQGESGGRIAAPIFRDFMREALHDSPPTPFRIPPGVRLVRIDSLTGLLPSATTTQSILEGFRPGTEPTAGDGANPFIFGGAGPTDPRVRSGPRNPTESNDQRRDGLDGLY